MGRKKQDTQKVLLGTIFIQTASLHVSEEICCEQWRVLLGQRGAGYAPKPKPDLTTTATLQL